MHPFCSIRSREAVGTVWYVVQVTTGREAAMAKLIERIVPRDLAGECFSPEYETERKVRGEFQTCTRPLLPGYVIAVTDAPAELGRVLGAIPGFTRVLTMGERYVPLRQDEMEFIAAFTEPGARVVPMSKGIKDGDRVKVVEGPLVGHEGLISRIDRRKSTAYLTFEICGRTVETRVGLAVVAAAEPVAAA